MGRRKIYKHLDALSADGIKDGKHVEFLRHFHQPFVLLQAEIGQYLGVSEALRDQLLKDVGLVVNELRLIQL